MAHRMLIAALLVIGSTPAYGQTTAWGPNGFVAINGVYQRDAKPFDDQLTLDIDHEAGTLSTHHDLEPGPAYDITAGGKLKGNLGFGFGASYYRRGSVATVTAALPHPLYFNQFRNVSGNTEGLTRQELAAHVHMMWQFPFSDRFQAVVFAGPSRFVVKQLMVENVEYAESYPYDVAQFVSATLVEQRGVRIGYNAGADVTFFFSRHMGVGALFRISRATVPLPSPDGDKVDVKAGGSQIGAGMRFRF